MFASAKVMPSFTRAEGIPSIDVICLISLLAESWFRTTAKTLRCERRAAVTAEVPMFPVDPTTRTVSIAALKDMRCVECDL